MNKLGEWLKRNPLGFSILLNFFLFITTYLFFDPFFRTNDDVGMMLQVMGKLIVLEPSEYIRFTHIYLGIILKWLYGVTPTIPWYGLYLILSLFLAHVVIAYILFRKHSGWSSLILYTFYFLIIGWEFVVGLQFTMVSYALCLSGFVLISSRGLKLTRREAVLGVFLIVFGSMVRWHSFLFAGLSIIPYLFFSYYRQPQKELIKPASLIVVACLCGLLLHIIDIQKYQNRDDWKEATEFGALAIQFFDQNRLVRDVDPSRRKEVLDSVGWTVNDYQMINSWFFMDESLYNIESMTKFSSQIAPLQTGLTTSYVTSMVRYIFINKRTMKLVSFLVLLLLIYHSSRDNYLALFSSIIFGSILLTALIFVQKPPPPRVSLSLFILYGFIGMAGVDYKKGLAITRPLFILFFMVGIIPSIHAFHQSRSNFDQFNQWWHSTIEMMSSNAEITFVSWANALPYELTKPLENLDYLGELKIIPLGANQRGPLSTSLMNEAGVEDLYADIYKNEKMQLMIANGTAHYLNLYKKYVSEHHGETLREVVTHKNRFYTIYNFKAESELSRLLISSKNSYLQGRFLQSIQVANQGLPYGYLQERFLNNICAAYNQIGQYDQAIEACEKALEISPDYEMARDNLTFIRQRVNQ